MNTTYFGHVVLENTKENLQYLIDCGEFTLYTEDLSWYDEKYLCICYDGVIDTTRYCQYSSEGVVSLEEFKEMVDYYKGGI